MNIFKKIGRAIKHPDKIVLYLNEKGFHRFISDKVYLKNAYKSMLGKKLTIKSPKTYNEKLQWLKLYDRNPLYTTLVDKYEVKNYIANRIGEEYIVPTLGVWDKFDDIDFDALPNQFVLKCTHDSGGLVICKDKTNLDIDSARQKIEKSLGRNYFWFGREWPYKNVPKRIIAEQFLEDEETKKDGITDYKFFCFNGEPKFLYVSTGLENHKTAHISFLTLDWNFTSFQRSDFSPLETLPKKPTKFDEMVEISRELSKDIPFLRVDLYQINNQIYFSELTFFPCSGFIPFVNPEDDETIGHMLVLPKEKTKNN